jgi:hypothetical protein
MNNAESVRQFQPRVALWQPWDTEGVAATFVDRKNGSTPFRVANHLLGHLNPGLQTLG